MGNQGKIVNNLVPRGRDPFGQRRGSGPLARWDFESANHGLPVTLRRIKANPKLPKLPCCRLFQLPLAMSVFQQPIGIGLEIRLARGSDSSSA